jgi:hypothetical protein
LDEENAANTLAIGDVWAKRAFSSQRFQVIALQDNSFWLVLVGSGL